MKRLTAGLPRAITMWDFSWLERRWPGAGYEDWDQALAELTDRGYDTVRIDAYPHLVSADPHRAWTLRPQWNQQSWGAQSVVDVQVLPNLISFIAAARRHGVAVGLSTWFREDVDNIRMGISSPEAIAAIWIDTLRHIEAAELLDAIYYVDLCNEFPLAPWAPFLYGRNIGEAWPRDDSRIGSWMRTSIELVREAYPTLDYTYSFTGPFSDVAGIDVDAFDLLEPHVWMAGASDFYDQVGYHFEFFESTGYDNLVAVGYQTYRAQQERFDAALFDEIERVARWSRDTGLPLVTTECWSIIDYKDWPGLDWGWVKELNERALQHALATKRWVALGTSNFCGPQFVGMWRDVDYHRRLTAAIHAGSFDPDLALRHA